ncbi:PPE domain-containing protein [Mycobacterium decipiens]|uniref:PPE family protein n=1 Tax=Mycobacterium decipiens TaxID=1430326 RepID=A0A1X2LW75_9MYCO|nr:PPE domain-containing protein [Mycobacterium decipiens]OSC40786.1 hypothetical protein B8W66_11425 [Mycobacterium decipiens]
MTMPVWAAFPPEVHSGLLRGGPGAESMLAASSQCTALSVEYALAAGELTALLDAVHAGVWQGPSAEAYAAAYLPYVAWLIETSCGYAELAASHSVTAGAYVGALADMPTLEELATNHAVHEVLCATNFFGINTIPIVINETDYARMWVQAAVVMDIYQAESTAASAAARPATPAPPIIKTPLPQNVFGPAPPPPPPPPGGIWDWIFWIYTQIYWIIDWITVNLLQGVFWLWETIVVTIGPLLTFLGGLLFQLGSLILQAIVAVLIPLIALLQNLIPALLALLSDLLSALSSNIVLIAAAVGVSIPVASAGALAVGGLAASITLPVGLPTSIGGGLDHMSRTGQSPTSGGGEVLVRSVCSSGPAAEASAPSSDTGAPDAAPPAEPLHARVVEPQSFERSAMTGFAGTAAKDFATQPKGLSAVRGHGFGNRPHVPVLPATWNPGLLSAAK